MKRSPELRAFVRELETAGCEVRDARSRGNSHLKIYYQGRLVGSLGGNLGNWRNADNLRSDLKREGVPL